MATAWTFVAAGGTGGAQSGSITLTLPTGHATNDMLLYLGTAHSKATTVPIPTGYTEIYTKSNWLRLAAKLDGGSETNPVIPTSSINMTCALCAFRGGPGTLPTVATSATTNNTTSGAGTINIPAITPSVNNGLVLALGACNDNFSPFTSYPSAYTGISNIAFSSGGQSEMWAYVIQTTAAGLSADSFAVGGLGAGTAADGSVIVLDSGIVIGTPNRSLLGVGT